MRKKHRRRNRARDIPDYLKKTLGELQSRQITPGVHVVDVFHDSSCDFLAGRGPCNCNPDVHLDAPGKN